MFGPGFGQTGGAPCVMIAGVLDIAEAGMDIAIEKAEALIEAHRYIRGFRDRIVVVKVGGSIQDERDRLVSLLEDVAFMSAVGMRPVVVHGGGKRITKAMSESGLEARFVQGRRYTDKRTLEIVERVLAVEVNSFIVGELSRFGARSMGLHSMGSCVLFGEKTGVAGASGQELDLGYVGKITEVNTDLIKALCEDRVVPVISPVAIARGEDGNADTAGIDGDGGGVWKLNVNADTVAGEVAAALQAEKLVMCSDTHGIRTDPADENSYASSLTRTQINSLVETGVIGSGMLPKVEACLRAMDSGAKKAHIVDGRVPHSILLEIYTDAGVGTEIVLG